MKQSAPTSESFYRTDEQRDVLCSLELCRDALRATAANRSMWKWVLVALHNAVQGAMVCHLSGSAQLGALANSNFKSALAYLNDPQSNKQVKPFLATPTELLNRLGDDEAKLEVAGDAIVISDQEKRAYEELNKLRRQLIHFNPSGWSIQIEGYSDHIAMDSILLLSKIRADGYALRHMSESELARFDVALSEIQSTLSNQ